MHKNMYLYKMLHSLICSRSKKEITQDNSAPLPSPKLWLPFYPLELSADGHFVLK